ncbi:MAG: type II toxin-antitoxin system YhaV family toxin [Pontibacterium sp.]
MTTTSAMVVNGWTLYLHPLMLAEVSELTEQVEKLKQKDPEGYLNRNASKRLAAITKLMFQIIPQDPSAVEFRQGKTLGAAHKHWFRAKFFQQYRLFFRYDSKAKIIVYAWVNNEKTKRAYHSKTDAYLVFEHMLLNGNPPDSWQSLLAEAKSSSPS